MVKESSFFYKIESDTMASKKVFENRVEFNKAKVILEAKAELINVNYSNFFII